MAIQLPQGQEIDQGTGYPEIRARSAYLSAGQECSFAVQSHVQHCARLWMYMAPAYTMRDIANGALALDALETWPLGSPSVYPKLVEEDPSILSDTTIPVGLGPGLIAASVAAAAVNTSSVITLGLEGIAVAYRLGVTLQRICPACEESDWPFARVLSGYTLEDVQRLLTEVNSAVPLPDHAYVSESASEEHIVLSRPSTLETLSRMPAVAEGTIRTAKVQSLKYLSDLSPVNTQEIVEDTCVNKASTVRRSLYSVHTPKEPVSAETMGDLWCYTSLAIAHQPMRMKETFQTVGSALQGTGNSEVVLIAIGSHLNASSLHEILSQHDQVVREGGLNPCPKASGNDVDSIPSESIAVVGMSGRFPKSDTLDELWHLLESGTTTHQEIPSSRFNVHDFYDPFCKKHNSLVSRHGCFIRTPGDFDYRLFNISPREALQMDPVQRMLLMTTYEALEMAGYGEKSQDPAPRIATYFGQTVDDWKTINEQQGIDTHFLPAVNRGFAPGRLCHYFKWAGGFFSIDTGCSSSATSICIARDQLVRGDCDAAVVGGGTLLTAPEWFSGLGQGGFLSPTGACKTFSDEADGYCRGEGVAVIVLKRLSDAIEAKDDVLAVIGGAARNTNAGEASITHPGAKAQEALYRRVLRQAAVLPSEVGVIEMHGTGTQAGDRCETMAVRNVFASSDGHKRPQPLIVGAVKANLGHSEAAAGIVSIIKVILMLHHNTIPPQPNQPIKLNPHLLPVLGPGTDVQLANGQAWPRNSNNPRYVLVNNFDAAGGNGSVLLHDAPTFARPSPPSQSDALSHHIVVTSGRTEVAQVRNRNRLREYLLQHPETPLASLAYTTTARRMHQNLRDAYVTSSMQDLLDQMKQPAGPVPMASSVVFAFTGQGSGYIGMGGTLYRSSPTFRHTLDSYQQILNAQGLDSSFLDFIRGNKNSAAKNLSILRDMQVATVALEIALARYWQSLGVRPTLLIGHSLGEYAALCIAGVLSVSNALALAHARAQLICARCPPFGSGMLSVSLHVNAVRQHIEDLTSENLWCEVCCINGPSSTVVGGSMVAIEKLEQNLKSEGSVTTTRLQVSHAFHTCQMVSLLDDLEVTASKMKFHAPALPVASTLLGKIVQPGEDVFNASYIRRHTREPVAFLDAVRACEAEGHIQDQSFVIEIGPGSTCINLLASSLLKANPARYPSLRSGRDDWATISQCLAAAYRAQLPVDWTQFHKAHLDQVQLISGLPTYAFDCQNFWVSYKTPEAPQARPDAKSDDPSSRLSSTSLHFVEDMRREGSNLFATFAADLSDTQLADAIGGHVVDGVAICPASIFMDMAYTAASHLETEYRKVSTTSLTTYELRNLKMTNPLVLRKGMGVEDLPRVSLESNLNESNATLSIRFLSRSIATDSSTELGSCTIHLNESQTPVNQAWSRLQPLVKARMDTLETSLRPKQVHAMDRQLFYKVFSEIVDYSAPYQAVEEAIVSTDFHDGAFVFHLPPSRHLGTFCCSPFAIDAAVHVVGFLLNADVCKPKDDVHIANHIGSLRVLGDLSSQGPWRAYATVRDRNAKAGTSFCDVYVTDSRDNLLVLCTDICFKKLDRNFFSLLTGSARTHAQKSRPLAASKPMQTPITQASSSESSTAASAGATTPESSQPDAVDLAVKLFLIVAQKTGISLADLKRTAHTTFTDFGIDSQMSIQILADFHRRTTIELPASFFTSFPTPADVEKELSMQELDDCKGLDPVSEPRHEGNTMCTTTQHPSKQLFSIIAEALDLNTDDFTPSTTFESLGMDSMLSIKTLANFRQETDIELPAAFFTEFSTVAAVREELDGPLEEPGIMQVSSETGVSHASTTTEHPPQQQKIHNAISRSILMQGKSRSQDAPLFMATDGSGTVDSYIHLRPLLGGRQVYGLESPFVEDSDAFDLTVGELAAVFIRTIRRIQPHGPYLIGGWSAGSVYAYEIAHRLFNEGETIDALIILDMRAPSLNPIPLIIQEFVSKLSTFDTINRDRNLPELTAKQKAHLRGTCRALSSYVAAPFPPGQNPRYSTVVWARSGLDKRDDAPLAAMSRPSPNSGTRLDQLTQGEFEQYFNSWFYGRRTQFGTNGWEALLGDKISVHDIDGDHFTMMKPPFVDAIGHIIRNTVMKATARIEVSAA
ncbi:MAG: hypothetical protein Q9162_000719 [Coniocarpon cinnabarinum]